MPIHLGPLPYDLDGLEPYISATTLKLHYKKHHAKYVSNVNELIVGTSYADMSLEDIVLKAWRRSDHDRDRKIFDNSSQAWNHTFMWNRLSSSHGQSPSGALDKALTKAFGGADMFMSQFDQEALALFGSGWVWLVMNSDRTLSIFSGANAESPMVHGVIPLLVCDVWEHAYYLDYKNDRKLYLKNFWQLVDWEFVGKCFVAGEEILADKNLMKYITKEAHRDCQR